MGAAFFIGKTGKGGNRAYDTGRKHAKNGGVDDQDNETLIEEGNIGDNPLDITPENLDRLREIVEGLRLRVDELQEEINLIKSSFPYTMKEFLNDEEAVNTKQRELTNLLYEYDKQIEELEKRLADMLGKKEA